MAEPPIIGRTVITWICDVCKKLFSWDERDHLGDCCWFGSSRAMDDGDWDKIVVICSPACKVKAKPLVDAVKKKRNPRRGSRGVITKENNMKALAIVLLLASAVCAQEPSLWIKDNAGNYRQTRSDKIYVNDGRVLDYTAENMAKLNRELKENLAKDKANAATKPPVPPKPQPVADTRAKEITELRAQLRVLLARLEALEK